MKRWCRLSALQAKQALGHVHTWHCGTSASASATAVPLPTSLPKASSVCCALDLTCAALDPRPTHHLLVAPAPAQAFAGTALLAFLPTQRPSTSRANASLFPAAGASRTNCSTLIAEPKLLVIITNVTIGPGTTAFVSPDATSRIAASALAAGHPRRHRPHRRRHLCLHPPRPCLRRRTPSPPLPARPSPLAPSSPPPPSPSYPSHCLKRSTISALPTMSPTMSFIVSSLLPSLWFKV